MIDQRIEFQHVQELELIVEYANKNHSSWTVDNSGEVRVEQIELVNNEECKYESDANEIC